MKKAIYLDERERDLARRAFAMLKSRLDRAPLGSSNLEKFVISWTHDELAALSLKFAEKGSEE